MERELEREETAATTTRNPPSPDKNAGTITTTPPGSSTKSKKQEKRDTAMKSVEGKLNVWRHKRARAEAGLPTEDIDGGYYAGFPGACSGGGGGGGRGGGGGGGGSSAAAVAGSRGHKGGGRALCSAWPEVFNAPVRRQLPGERFLRGFPWGAGGRGGGGGGRGYGGGRGEMEITTAHLEAPWVMGLVDRPGAAVVEQSLRDDGAAGEIDVDEEEKGGEAEDGKGAGPVVDLVSSGNEEEAEQEKVKKGGAVKGESPVCAAKDKCRTPNKKVKKGGTVSVESPACTASGKCGTLSGEPRKGGAGAGGDSGGGGVSAGSGGGRGDVAFSDLHHEIVRFVEYVSLSPAEVRCIFFLKYGNGVPLYDTCVLFFSGTGVGDGDGDG